MTACRTRRGTAPRSPAGDHYGDRFDAFRRDMGAWIADGRVKVREHAPAALAGLLEGRNFGQLVVRVADA